MRKAFLCHSSEDKDYVRVVARRLGRAQLVFDELTFAPGEDFRASIRKGLEQTALFVVFVSRSSLQSIWCRHEIEAAEIRRQAGELPGYMAIIIDPTVSLGELPSWLQDAKAVIERRPSQAARLVQFALLAALPIGMAPPFVGRSDLQSELVTSLAELGPDRSKVLLVTGLDGIGRRSYLRRAVQDTLSLPLGPFCVLDETRTLTDVYLWALDETSDLSGRKALSDVISEFRQFDIDAQVERVAQKLAELCRTGCVPCLLDSGGMLDDHGRFLRPYGRLLERFTELADDQFMAIINRRRPFFAEDPFAEQVLAQQIGPLSEAESRLLLQQLLRRLNVKYTSDQLAELEQYVDGYPPAAIVASQHAARYGMAALISNKSALVDVKARRFTAFIRGLALSEIEWKLLQYLALEDLLPLTAIAAALSMTPDDIVLPLRSLIDQSLVVAIDDNYGASRPLRDSIVRVRGHIDEGNYREIGRRLTEMFWSKPDTAPSIEVVDATLHAVARGGSSDIDQYADLLRTSTVHRLARECYFRREFARARDYARRAEEMDPTDRNIKSIHFRSLVQLELWDQARTKLGELAAIGDPGVLYLKGFMLRRMRRHREAISALESALAAGNRSVSVYRDLAECYFRVGDAARALENITKVRAAFGENAWVLDLLAKVHTELGNLDEAERTLGELERVDVDGRFIHHRRAALHAKRGEWALASVEAETACRTGHAPFEAFTQRIDVEIERRSFATALQQLDELRTRFGKIRSDVQSGLRCKLLYAQGKWREAQVAWNALEDKTRPVHLGMLQRILELKSIDPRVPPSERDSARAQALEIARRVGSAPIGASDPEDDAEG